MPAIPIAAQSVVGSSLMVPQRKAPPLWQKIVYGLIGGIVGFTAAMLIDEIFGWHVLLIFCLLMLLIGWLLSVASLFSGRDDE